MRLRWLPLFLLLAGCVFRDAAEPRFYRPQSAALDAGVQRADDPPAPAGTSTAAVRLQTVNGTPFLRERIVWRSSDVEYGLYEQRRWSELPASYVQRALESALRDEPGLRLSDDYKAPALRVDVVAFDEVLAPAHVASVALVVSLRDDKRRRLLDRTFSTDAPIAGDTASAAAEAMGRALDQVVAEVAVAVAQQLRVR